MTRFRWFFFAAAAWLWHAGGLSAQTNPLAAISGHVTDPAGAPLGGVTISATSPALQGVRASATTAAGDFLIPFLPPGEYEVVFRRPGFREIGVPRSLRATETTRIDIRLELEGTAASITVSAEAAGVVSEAAAVGTTYREKLIDRLPVDRGPRGAALLAPGVATTNLGGNVTIAGAVTYENLYLVDGVVVKDRVFGQPRPFPVEDALEETTVAVAGASAEFGRFTGGVVNVVTRSGGNTLGGSLRVTLQNDAWRSLTPYERESADDPREDSLVPTYEATFGGPILRDRLWYFLAGRWQETDRGLTLDYTNVPYRYEAQEKRLEAKVTWSPLAGHNLRIAYGDIDTREKNVGGGMDLASLGTLRTPEDLLSINYTATVGRGLFLEGQYSRRRKTPTGRGARTTDLVGGTPLRDASRGLAGWNSPPSCAVCGVPEGELRKEEEEDRGFVLKASGFVSGPRIGAHDLVVGGEIADELRRSNAFQSGSGFIVNATSARLEGGAIYPVFLPRSTTTIEWRPLENLSTGSRFRTTSAFVNDRWRLGDHWSFNLGLRWDVDDSRDQSGVKVGDSDAWSPRLAAAFDPRGDGSWTFDAGFARYVTSLTFGIGDLGSSRGRSARYQYTYEGPAVNAGAGDPVSTGAALATLFGWFFANGGTGRPIRGSPAIPGLNRRVGPDLVPPRSDEITLGITKRFGNRGLVRLAGMRRKYSHQYSERADTSTGTVTDPAGRTFDMRLIGNDDRVERTYEALLLQVDLRIRTELRLAGSYTLSRTRGNFDGGDAVFETGGAIPEDDLGFYPEYGEERWRAPVGPLQNDQRHRARLWATYETPIAGGSLSVSALERVDSGQPWGAVREIDTRDYVTNPGYLQPPTEVPYFFEPRGSRRNETESATDLAIRYAHPVAGLGVELFTRIVVVNVFDQSAQTRPGDSTVLTSRDDRRLVPFHPFVETPVRGVNWDLGPDFGRAASAADFQQPRTFSVGFGARF